MPSVCTQVTMLLPWAILWKSENQMWAASVCVWWGVSVLSRLYQWKVRGSMQLCTGSEMHRLQSQTYLRLSTRNDWKSCCKMYRNCGGTGDQIRMPSGWRLPKQAGLHWASLQEPLHVREALRNQRRLPCSGHPTESTDDLSVFTRLHWKCSRWVQDT